MLSLLLAKLLNLLYRLMREILMLGSISVIREPLKLALRLFCLKELPTLICGLIRLFCRREFYGDVTLSILAVFGLFSPSRPPFVSVSFFLVK